jgi:hypothetical protein
MGVRKSDREGKFDQSTLCECMEMTKWNLFVQLIYAKKKEKRNHCGADQHLLHPILVALLKVGFLPLKVLL